MLDDFQKYQAFYKKLKKIILIKFMQLKLNPNTNLRAWTKSYALILEVTEDKTKVTVIKSGQTTHNWNVDVCLYKVKTLEIKEEPNGDLICICDTMQMTLSPKLTKSSSFLKTAQNLNLDIPPEVSELYYSNILDSF
jgi:hypothetical protein